VPAEDPDQAIVILMAGAITDIRQAVLAALRYILIAREIFTSVHSLITGNKGRTDHGPR